ncbi:hypothetical protein P0G09_20580, partial [Faecalibacterium sp. DFI.5.82]|nr:hypothetical protein [Faecalibacterium sp. DFI.5.82]
FDAARAGDALAAREVDEMTDTLGMALASIASTTDPEIPAPQGHGMACRDFAGHHAFHWHCYHGRSVDGALL